MMGSPVRKNVMRELFLLAVVEMEGGTEACSARLKRARIL